MDTLDGIEALTTYLADKEYIAYDSETNGLHKSSTVIGFSVCAEAAIAYYVILHKYDQATNTLQPMPYLDAATDLIRTLQGKSLIMHNAVFDCMMAESYFKVRLIDSIHTDTMILAHLLNENRRVGLKELAKEMYGDNSASEAAEMKASVLANGGKLTKQQYEMWKADSYIMGKYGAKDAWLTYKLFYDLVPQLFDQGLDKFFYEDESMPLLRGPTYQLNNTGLKVDGDKLVHLKKILEAECAEALSFVNSEISTHVYDKKGYSVRSNQQLAWLLYGKLGLEFGSLTKVGKDVAKHLGTTKVYTLAQKRNFLAECSRREGEVYSPEAIVNGKKVRAKTVRQPWAYTMVDKKALEKLAPKQEWIKRLLEYQRKMKILTTYVKGIENRMQYGVIRPSFLQHGTTSGRYSSRDPNFQNLPRDDKRVKACIVARPKHIFVGADYSQLEPRVFAYFSNDQRLLTAFKGEDDFYSVIGMEVYDKYDCTPRKEGSTEAFGIKYKKLRDHSKTIALAVTYGATAYQLAPVTGKSINDTAEDIERYFERFPDVRQMMLDSHALAKKDGQVVNLFGRPRRMPLAKQVDKLYGPQDHADLPYEIRNMLNLAVNHRIQSTAASIVNRAAIHFDNSRKTAGIICSIVLQVHDSLVVECKEEDAKDIALLLQNSMETAVDLKTVSLEAIPRIGESLSDV